MQIRRHPRAEAVPEVAHVDPEVAHVDPEVAHIEPEVAGPATVVAHPAPTAATRTDPAVTRPVPDPTIVALRPGMPVTEDGVTGDPGDEPDGRLSDVDEWGRSERVRSVARTLFDPVYARWFRVEWEGFDRIPADGPALLVANHAGAIPSDAPVIMHGIEKELGRPVYGMADSFFRTIPFVGTLWSRAGGVPALPDNAYRLLHDQGRLVLVFPEGTKATSKSFGDRYHLRRFGRGGFVEIAIRAGVPIIPIAVMGAEETMPILFRLPAVAKALGLPYFPVTANMVVLGPAGALIPFPSKFTLRVLDPITLAIPPDRDHYPRSLLMEEAERIRQLLQQHVDQMRRERRSVWFG